MTKRSFFKSLMGAVAAVALAPEIAFGVRLKMPEAPKDNIWWLWVDGNNSHWLLTEDYVERWKHAEIELRNAHMRPYWG